MWFAGMGRLVEPIGVGGQTLVIQKAAPGEIVRISDGDLVAIRYQDLFEQHHNTDARYVSATNAWVDIGV
jgi:hypothetical protein